MHAELHIGPSTRRGREGKLERGTQTKEQRATHKSMHSNGRQGASASPLGPSRRAGAALGAVAGLGRGAGRRARSLARGGGGPERDLGGRRGRRGR